MVVTGHIGSQQFQYVKIGVEGCTLGDECLPAEEISKQSFNFFSLNAWPNLLGENIDKVVTITTDMSYYK